MMILPKFWLAFILWCASNVAAKSKVLSKWTFSLLGNRGSTCVESWTQQAGSCKEEGALAIAQMASMGHTSCANLCLYCRGLLLNVLGTI